MLTRKQIALLVCFFAFVILVCGLHAFYGLRPAGDTGVRNILDSLFAILLIALVLLFSFGIGQIVLAKLGFDNLLSLEAGLISCVLGLGVISYGVLALGSIGFLTWQALLGWLILVGLIGAPVWSKIFTQKKIYKITYPSIKKTNLIEKSIYISIGILFLLTIFQALAPPWEYDSALYHLEVPRKFLISGGIVPSPEDWLTYFPLTVEMLFTLGLGLGSDVFAKLVQLSYSVILILAIYSLGRRMIGSRVSWMGAMIMLGIPILPLWASWAYNDMGWTVYVFLSITTALYWSENHQRRWLVLSGILMGFALGTKYQSAYAAAGLGIWILWQEPIKRWRQKLNNALVFTSCTLIICSPWYLKNLFWTGNPIYPLIYADPSGWSSSFRQIWMSFVRGFGTGRSFFDYLLLPVNLYLKSERFSTYSSSIELPSLLFPLLIFYPFTQRKRFLDAALLISGFYFLAWAFSSQVSRYLLPIFPFLSMIVGHTLIDLGNRFRPPRFGALLCQGLISAMVIITLIYTVALFAKIRPLGVVTGLESTENFLRRNVSNYAALDYIKSELPESNRVLMLWDGRGYYCDQRCIPDIAHSQWTDIVFRNKNVASVASYLEAQGITHLLFNEEDAEYLVNHDPLGYQMAALEFLVDEFRPACTQEVYTDSLIHVYKLTCS